MSRRGSWAPMMKFWTPIFAIALALSAVAGSARAGAIHYIFNGVCGDAACSLGGAPFGGAFTVTLSGDTANVDNAAPPTFTNVASQADFVAGPLSATLTGVTSVFAASGGPFGVPVVGFRQDPTVNGMFLEGGAAFLDYDLAGAFPLTAATELFAPLGSVTFYTSAGELVFNQAYVYDFQAIGVPEPTTWAMLLLGFGGLGAVMRAAGRRRTAPRA